MSGKSRAELAVIQSRHMGEQVELSALVPVAAEPDEELALIVDLHGGGADRMRLHGSQSAYEDAWTEGHLQKAVVVSFSAGPLSFYAGPWERFIVEELTEWAITEHGATRNPELTAITGISMGGYGALKVGLRNPERFRTIAAVEPGLIAARGFDRTADTILVIGDEDDYAAGNPVDCLLDNIERVRAAGQDIYLEVGDEDCLNLHYGTEYFHRLLWDNDIRHEYHLVRWANHVGPSIPGRQTEAIRFIGNSLRRTVESRDPIATSDEEVAMGQWMAGGLVGPPPGKFPNLLTESSVRVMEAGFAPQREEAAKSYQPPRKNYRLLPPTEVID